MDKPNTFDAWIKSEGGRKCMQWPVSAPEYLHNRLYWAYHAGGEKAHRLQETIEWYERTLRQLRKENKKLKEEILTNGQ